MQTALELTLRYCPVLAILPEGRFAAVVDTSFNFGAGRLQTSTLWWLINQRNWAAASDLMRWVYSDGNLLSGLVTRRKAEVVLLIAGV